VKIWDHAGGVLVVEEAGGTATDVGGRPLNFRLGRELRENRGVVVTNGKLHERVLAALAQVGVRWKRRAELGKRSNTNVGMTNGRTSRGSSSTASFSDIRHLDIHKFCPADLVLPVLSIVIPVLNEADSLLELYRQIDGACSSNAIDAELIFVDDGSTDGSWAVIREIAQRDARVSGIRFRRNFGKAAALTAGLRSIRGDLVLTMDADLQDDPAEIPRLLAKLNEGFDVVNGWKERRLDPWHKVYPSRVFNWMVGALTGLRLHDHNCGLKLFRAEVAREIRLYGERHRFIPVLAHARGFRVTELAVNHRPRQHGVSKYGVRRFLRGFLDLLTIAFLTGFSQRPQHLLGACGLFSFALGALGLIYLAATWVLMHVFKALPAEPIGDRPLLIYSAALLLLGGQALSLGLLAELIVSLAGREEEAFSVRERTNRSGI
jgi:glycosyltransferase involved in cell wall biosynthesis